MSKHGLITAEKKTISACNHVEHAKIDIAGWFIQVQPARQRKLETFNVRGYFKTKKDVLYPAGLVTGASNYFQHITIHHIFESAR